MVSVRRTALIWMTALLTLVGLMGASLAYLVDLTQANILLDRQLRQIAINAGLGVALRGPSGARQDADDEIVVQVWDDGTGRPQSSNPDIEIPRQAMPGFSTIEVASGAWRSFAAMDGHTSVQASQRLSVRTQLAQTAALEAATPILITIPLGWLVVGWALQRILGRLGALAGVIAERSADTQQPISVERIPIEVSPLVSAMNQLLARLHKGMDQQKQFVSDAAHELRTPLAALRLQIDNLMVAGTDAPTDAALRELGRGAGRASALVDQLLRLARYDSRSQAPERQAIDLVRLVVSCLSDHVQVAEGKKVDLGMTAADPARIIGSERELHILIGNLIENAVRYTSAGGVVDVAIRVRNGLAELEVSDTGCGIPETLMPRVFDRFFRAVPPDIEGTGLGLAICKAIADRHGLKIKLCNRKDRQGLIATLEAPLHPAAG